MYGLYDCELNCGLASNALSTCTYATDVSPICGLGLYLVVPDTFVRFG